MKHGRGILCLLPLLAALLLDREYIRSIFLIMTLSRSAAVRVMVRLMTKGPATAAEIGEELGLQYSAVKNALATLRKLGFAGVVGHARRKLAGRRGAIPRVWGADV